MVTIERVLERYSNFKDGFSKKKSLMKEIEETLNSFREMNWIPTMRVGRAGDENSRMDFSSFNVVNEIFNRPLEPQTIYMNPQTYRDMYNWSSAEEESYWRNRNNRERNQEYNTWRSLTNWNDPITGIDVQPMTARPLGTTDWHSIDEIIEDRASKTADEERASWRAYLEAERQVQLNVKDD